MLMEAFESKGLVVVDLGRSKVLVNEGCLMDGLSIIKIDPCGMRCLKVKANSLLCVKYDECINSRWAELKRVTVKI